MSSTCIVHTLVFDFWLTTKHSKAILHACCIEPQNNRYIFKLKGDEDRNVNSSVARGSLTVLAIVRVKANKQADMDVSPAMGDMLTEMQGCLKQLCGNSAAGNPEAVAQLIAEEMAAMNSSPGHNRVQDKCDDVLTLPAPAEMAAPRMHVDLSTRTQSCTTGLIQAPALYDTSGNISSVQLAWSEWRHGPHTIAERVKQIKADTTLVLGRRNSSLHKKNRHLPQLIESMIQLGATEAMAVNLAIQIADDMSLTLDQIREGARLIAGHTAKQEHHSLTAETTVTLGQSTDKQCHGLTNRSAAE